MTSKIKAGKKLNRYEKLSRRHAWLVSKIEAGDATSDDIQEFRNIQVILKNKEKSRFGSTSPSEAQEQIIRQAHGYHRATQALTKTLELVFEVLEDSYDPDNESYQGDLMDSMFAALQEGPKSAVEWAAKESERRARKEIENVDLVDADDSDGGGGDGGDLPAPADEEAGDDLEREAAGV